MKYATQATIRVAPQPYKSDLDISSVYTLFTDETGDRAGGRRRAPPPQKQVRPRDQKMAASLKAGATPATAKPGGGKLRPYKGKHKRKGKGEDGGLPPLSGQVPASATKTELTNTRSDAAIDNRGHRTTRGGILRLRGDSLLRRAGVANGTRARGGTSASPLRMTGGRSRGDREGRASCGDMRSGRRQAPPLQKQIRRRDQKRAASLPTGSGQVPAGAT
jgi:hypothetical protein